MELNLRDVALVALISSLYAIGTILIAPISYGVIQARLTDSLILLSYLPDFGFCAVLGVTLGNIIANFFSPYGLPDIVLGTLANLFSSLSVMYISRLKIKYGVIVAALVASLEIAIIVGIGLLYFIYSVSSVELAFFSIFAGELISIVVVGTVLIKAVSNFFRKSKQN